MDGPMVIVKQGKLRGVVVENVLGSHYIAFKGIPFAAPPVGNLRFRDPEPPASWSGVRDASQNAGVICAQMDQFNPENFMGGEDCLYLSIYTTSVTECKPVMVWIHGGAFLSGGGNDNRTRADYLITKDIVLVSINYRLGALGFLNLGHETASGNQDFKDQVAALEWIKENIMNFGGDPNNITIFGVSAGGASVQLLMLSPLSKGLFHKAIIQSGVATSKWAMNKEQEACSFKLASILGKESENPVEVAEFLRTIPVAELVRAQLKVLEPEKARTLFLPFAATIDNKAKRPFLPLPIYQLFGNANNIPVIVGHTSHEYIISLKDSSEEALQTIYADLPLYAMKYVDSPEKVVDLTRRIKKRYFPNEKVDIPSIVQCFSDYHINIETQEFVDYRRKKKETLTYYYQFFYVGNEYCSTKRLMKELPMIGASHVDDLPYIFYSPPFKIDNPAPPAIGTKDRRMLERLTTMWTNFARTGNPTPNADECVTTIWQSATADAFNYLKIDDELELLTFTDYDNVFRGLK